MGLSISSIREQIKSSCWIYRKTSDGSLMNDTINNLRPFDNVSFGQNANESDLNNALEIAKTNGLRLVAPKECKNGIVQMWAVPLQ